MPFKKIGGLWISEGKNGKYMFGKLTAAVAAGTKLFVFKNNRKKPGEKYPDYEISIQGEEEAEDQSQDEVGF